MIHLEGEKTFDLPAARLHAKFTDLRYLSTTLPDVAEVKSITDKAAELVIRPKLGFIGGSLRLTIEKLSEEAAKSASMRLVTKGIGSSATVLASYTLEETAGRTLMRWQADVQEMGGLLKAVPSGLMKGSAQSVISGLLDSLEKELKQGEP